MSVASEITIDVSDPKAAKKALNAAIRAEKKRVETDHENWVISQTRGNAAGYRILVRCSLLTGEDLLKGLGVSRSHQAAFDYSVRPVKSPHDGSTRDYQHEITTEHGTAVLGHQGCDIVAAVSNRSGWLSVIFLRDRYTDQTAAYAVGICADQISLCDLPGITIDMFTADTE